MELQIKELQSQAMKYDKELAEFSERKEFEFGKFSLEGLDAKSLPFLSQSGRNKVMKRKKRKRVEEVVDVVSYMSQHNLFSYYGRWSAIMFMQCLFVELISDLSMCFLCFALQKIISLSLTLLLCMMILAI